MKEGPDISRAASVIGDPARANMLCALMDGRALTATELATEAGITKQTASAHLARLCEEHMLLREVQGRHHYFRLAGPEVAGLVEALMGFAQKHSGSRVRTGPRDPAMRRARVCYDHLAGEFAVEMYENFSRHGLIAVGEGGLHLTGLGIARLSELGIDADLLTAARRPVCRECLDWSARRPHLAGGAGKAILDTVLARGWAKREQGSRVVRFTPAGERNFRSWHENALVKTAGGNISTTAR